MKTKSLLFAKLNESTSEILKKAGDPKSAAPELLKFMCGWFDCQWGTYWHVDARRLILTPAYVWNNATLRAEKLKRDTASRSLSLSEGTAGHVWRTGLPVCTDNLIRDMCLPRSLDASEVGLRGGIWFPIRTVNTTYAVVELLGDHYWTCDERILNEIKTLGLALGAICACK